MDLLLMLMVNINFKKTLHDAYIKYVSKCTSKNKKQPVRLNNKSMKLIKKKYKSLQEILLLPKAL